MSYVDRKGSKIKNNWFYRLDVPNTWDKEVLGQVVWGQGNNYYFIPWEEEDRKLMYQEALNFTPLIQAPSVRQDVRLTKEKNGPKGKWDRFPGVRR